MDSVGMEMIGLWVVNRSILSPQQIAVLSHASDVILD